MEKSRSKRIDVDVRKLSTKYTINFINGTKEFLVNFHGPKGSPYEGGLWAIRIDMPDSYPFKSPSIGFINRIYHPNVDEASGSICLDVISHKWSPIFDLSHVFDHFLPQLLQEPNTGDPLNLVAAQHCHKDHDSFVRRVRDYIDKYATVNEIARLMATLMPNAPSVETLLVQFGLKKRLKDQMEILNDNGNDKNKNRICQNSNGTDNDEINLYNNDETSILDQESNVDSTNNNNSRSSQSQSENRNFDEINQNLQENLRRNSSNNNNNSSICGLTSLSDITLILDDPNNILDIFTTNNNQYCKEYEKNDSNKLLESNDSSSLNISKSKNDDLDKIVRNISRNTKKCKNVDKNTNISDFIRDESVNNKYYYSDDNENDDINDEEDDISSLSEYCSEDLDKDMDILSTTNKKQDYDNIDDSLNIKSQAKVKREDKNIIETLDELQSNQKDDNPELNEAKFWKNDNFNN